MAWNIYPSETPVGTWNGDYADRAREYQHTRWINWVKQSPLSRFRCEGGAMNGGVDPLSVDVAAGIYVMDGWIAQNDAAVNVLGLTDNATNYIWARATITGDLITGAEYYINITGNVPAESCALVGIVPMSGGGRTFVSSQAVPRFNNGTFTYEGRYAYYMFLGYQPKLVGIKYTQDEGGEPDYNCSCIFHSLINFSNGQPGNYSVTFNTYGFTINGNGANSSNATLYWEAMP